MAYGSVQDTDPGFRLPFGKGLSIYVLHAAIDRLRRTFTTRNECATKCDGANEPGSNPTNNGDTCINHNTALYSDPYNHRDTDCVGFPCYSARTSLPIMFRRYSCPLLAGP